jgi:hypothetical protein
MGEKLNEANKPYWFFFLVFQLWGILISMPQHLSLSKCLVMSRVGWFGFKMIAFFFEEKMIAFFMAALHPSPPKEKQSDS